MIKLNINKHRNTVEIFQWMTKNFGNDDYNKNWRIITYATNISNNPAIASIVTDTYLEIFQGDPEKITLAIIRWS